MVPRFHTVLRQLKSPENVGLIVRQHAAFAGGKLIFLGHDRPWQFRKSTQAFSRRLESLCEIVSFNTDEEFFRWAEASSVHVAAVEIDRRAHELPNFNFPEETAIVVGNESDGLPADFLNRCGSILTIPQYGPVACLNVAASAIIAMYEIRRSQKNAVAITGARYDVPKTGLRHD